MKRELTDAEIESALRVKAAPLADDGFTMRVMQALPKSEPARISAKIRPVTFPWFYFTLTAIVAVAAFLLAFAPSTLPGGSQIQSTLGEIQVINWLTQLTSSVNISSIAVIALIFSILFLLDSRDTSPE